jgi:hypothetical protein
MPVATLAYEDAVLALELELQLRLAARSGAANGSGAEAIAADPAGWMRDTLGADLWEKQVEIAEAVRDHRRVAVKSCHGVGKSWISARIATWFLHAHPNSIVITTAPTDRQVRNILWREIRQIYASIRGLLGRCLQMGIEIAPNWYALGFKGDDASPDSFQGFHSDWILVIVDEAAGVAESVFEALDAMMSSEHAYLLYIGNPTSDSGTFRDAFNRNRALYHTITIKAEDSPNVVAGQVVRPYLITKAWVDETIAKYGEESPYVQARVNAEFPDSVSGSLIPLSKIEAAAARELEPSEPSYLGVDVARYGDDESVICHRRGPVFRIVHVGRGQETTQTAGAAVIALRAADWNRAKALGVDAGDLRTVLKSLGLERTIARVDGIGIGAGVVGDLKEADQEIEDMQAGGSSDDPEHFLNKRAEWYWGLRERFMADEIDIDDDQELIAQLSSIRYKFTSRGQVQIESKEDAKKRGVGSPDKADALAMAGASRGAAGIRFLTAGPVKRAEEVAAWTL